MDPKFSVGDRVTVIDPSRLTGRQAEIIEVVIHGQLISYVVRVDNSKLPEEALVAVAVA